MYMKKKGYFKANGIRYKGIVALAGWLRVQTMGEYRHCDGLPALRKYFFGIPHCQHSLFSFGTLLTPPTKRTSPIYITTFWAVMFQIYALFGALFTSLNSALVTKTDIIRYDPQFISQLTQVVTFEIRNQSFFND